MSQLEDKSIYGLTQNTVTNEYMLVFDEFRSKRYSIYGKCANCKRYNTSPAWCQTCDPQKTTQGWTSGNKDIDECIKEFQLKATSYHSVIEWISFNSLANIQNIGDKVLATWFDGIRYLNSKYVNNKYEYTQSRIPSYKVELKILAQSQNLINLLKEVRLCLCYLRILFTWAAYFQVYCF
jgi:hypothetical protein